jgi:hypothetical protein
MRVAETPDVGTLLPRNFGACWLALECVMLRRERGFIFVLAWLQEVFQLGQVVPEASRCHRVRADPLECQE